MLFYKKNISVVCLSIIICCVFSSCQKQKITYKGYYNIDSLVEAQIHYLPTHKISLSKETGLNGKTDSIQIAITDTILWSKELEVFKQLNVINRPINANLYRAENVPDLKSNLTVRAFIPNRKLTVEYLKIYYDGSVTNLRKVEALYHEENPLYEGSRKLSMEFENIYNKITLVNYSIDGKQKVLFGDSVKFFLKGRVIIN